MHADFWLHPHLWTNLVHARQPWLPAANGQFAPPGQHRSGLKLAVRAQRGCLWFVATASGAVRSFPDLRRPTFYLGSVRATQHAMRRVCDRVLSSAQRAKLSACAPPPLVAAGLGSARRGGWSLDTPAKQDPEGSAAIQGAPWRACFWWADAYFVPSSGLGLFTRPRVHQRPPPVV